MNRSKTLAFALLLVSMPPSGWTATKKAAQAPPEPAQQSQPAQQPQQPQQGSSVPSAGQPMSETVKGQVKEELNIQKPAPTIELDVKEIIESGTAQTENVLQEAKPVPSAEDF